MASNRDKLDSLVSRVAIVFNGFSRTVVNADGSIDAQVTLQLRKRESAADLLYNVEEFIKDEKIWQQMPEKTFINSGIVYERTNAEAQAYKKKHKRRTALGESIGRGLAQANTSYYGGRSAVPASTLSTDRYVLESLKGSGFEKPHELFFRVYWHPRGRHPSRKRMNRRVMP